MKKLFKSLFPSIKQLLISVSIGLSTAGFIYFGFLQRHFFSYRYLLYAIAIVCIISIFSGWINQRFLIKFLCSLSKTTRIFSIIVSIFLSVFLLFNIQLQPIYYLLPDSNLEIDFIIDQLPEDEEGVRLKWIDTGQGYVPYTYIDYLGNWERVLGNTFFSSDQSAKMTWSGKVGTNTEIAFRKTPYDQPITITWNGESKIYNLYGSPDEDILIQNEFKINPKYFLPFVLSTGLFFFYFILLLLLIISAWKRKFIKTNPQRKFNWLFYTMPMLITWLITLFILWPGILTNDSLSIWERATYGNISDWQSALYIFIISLLIKLIPSPAFILIFQIIIFSIVVAWGLSTLIKLGLPQFVAWIISFLMAVFPPNIIYSVTLWKDIPYAISILLLTIFLIKIVSSKGEWGKNPVQWISLGLVAFFVTTLRHNGGPSALLSLIFLPIIYRKKWKYFIYSIILGLLLYFATQSGLYNVIIEDNQDTGQSSLVYLHHIGAHLDQGTSFSQSEVEYLNQFLPISDWNYTCCYVGTLSYDPDLERTNFLNNSKANRNLAISLFLRNPTVDISHALCAGELSYKFMNTQQCDHIKSLHGFISTKPGNVDWIGNSNVPGISENSLLPDLIDPLIKTLRPFGFFDSNLVIYLRPAFWLFIAIISISIWTIQQDNIKYGLPIIPILSQSAVLLLIGFAPAFRYYYSNCIVGLLLLGLIFLPSSET